MQISKAYIEKLVNFIPWWKRPFDILFSIFALALISPLMLIIALIIKLTDGGSVFYGHTRVGYNGKKFKVLKFRSMYMDADKRLKEILEKNPEARREWENTFKLKNDPRVTPIGKFLRKTSLDELPQFFNVLKGDMSVVGPRPVVEEELEKYYRDKAELYKSVRPGVTGYWQVEGRSDVEDYEERVKMDEWYIKNQSFWLDLKIILKTIKVMLTGKGAY
jgi:Undecaprenyl-phosphate galactose phosphotransferase WbaP